MHGLAADKLVIIQHQDNFPGRGVQVIDEACQNCFRMCRAYRRQELRGLTPDRVVSLLQGSDQIAQEALRLVVILV